MDLCKQYMREYSNMQPRKKLRHTPTHIHMRPQIWTRLIRDVKEKMIKKKKKKKPGGISCRFTLQRSQAISSKPPLRPRTVVLWSQRARRREGEREKLISAFVEFPHLPLEEAVHLVVPFINVSLSFPPLSPPSLPFFSIDFKGTREQVRRRRRSRRRKGRGEEEEEVEVTGEAEDMKLKRF